jgi:hypothetical protein
MTGRTTGISNRLRHSNALNIRKALLAFDPPDPGTQGLAGDRDLRSRRPSWPPGKCPYKGLREGGIVLSDPLAQSAAKSFADRRCSPLQLR